LLAAGGDRVKFAHGCRVQPRWLQLFGQAEQAVVSPLIAEGTTTIWWPARAHLATRLATLRMRSGEPIDVPPYL